MPVVPLVRKRAVVRQPLGLQKHPTGDRGKNKPLVRKAGARQRLALALVQATFTPMVW